MVENPSIPSPQPEKVPTLGRKYKMFGDFAVKENVQRYGLDLEEPAQRRVARAMAAKDLLRAKEEAKKLDERKRADTAIVEASIDKLTGLHVKNAFEPDIEEEISSLKEGKIHSLGVIRLDLDYFSWLNDVLEAHALGDYFLSTAGRIILDNLRVTDKAFRIGGDEFGIIVKDAFTNEEFLHIVDRLHNSLNKKILSETLEVLLRSKRKLPLGQDKMEREGTIAIRQFLIGLRNLIRDVDGRKEHFLTHGRGDPQQKQAFLERLTSFESYMFNFYTTAYLNDQRVWDELSAEEKLHRLSTEKDISELISHVMNNLSVSTAGIVVDKNEMQSFNQIDGKVDGLVNKIKRQGGGKYIAEIGFSGIQITDRRRQEGS